MPKVCPTCGCGKTPAYTARASAKFRQAHREEARKYAREYYAANKDRIKAERREKAIAKKAAKEAAAKENVAASKI
jgi:hypothetical protein